MAKEINRPTSIISLDTELIWDFLRSLSSESVSLMTIAGRNWAIN